MIKYVCESIWESSVESPANIEWSKKELLNIVLIVLALHQRYKTWKIRSNDADTYTHKTHPQHSAIRQSGNQRSLRFSDTDAIKTGYYQSFRDIQRDCIISAAENLVFVHKKIKLCLVSISNFFFKRKKNQNFKFKSVSIKIFILHTILFICQLNWW